MLRLLVLLLLPVALRVTADAAAAPPAASGDRDLVQRDPVVLVFKVSGTSTQLLRGTEVFSKAGKTGEREREWARRTSDCSQTGSWLKCSSSFSGPKKNAPFKASATRPLPCRSAGRVLMVHLSMIGLGLTMTSCVTLQ
eukprot:scpid95483/ scgid16568/ 